MRLAVIGCLLSTAAAAFANPVTNADPDPGDPAVIAIVNSAGDIGCTASVIAPHTGITAAHCVVGRDPTTLRVFFGNAVGGDGLYIPISDARAHPGFDPGGRDIAVFTLRVRAPVTPLVLAGPLDGSLVGTNIRAVGFGFTAGAAADAGIKREGTARISSVQPEELVAVPGPSLSCLGDSGGPALLPAGTIAGVVSRVDAMCVDHAVYTRVDIAQDVLIQPYLAETAPGAAGEGEPCFYDDHCATGLECAGDVKRVCESAGCGCASGSPGSLVILVAGFVLGRRRRH